MFLLNMIGLGFGGDFRTAHLVVCDLAIDLADGAGEIVREPLSVHRRRFGGDEVGIRVEAQRFAEEHGEFHRVSAVEGQGVGGVGGFSHFIIMVLTSIKPQILSEFKNTGFIIVFLSLI